jgi:hypothetical protein
MTSDVQCARCNMPVTGARIVQGDEVFHFRCWPALPSQVQIDESLELNAMETDPVRRILARVARAPTSPQEARFCPTCLQRIEYRTL